jgi:sodium-dependent dicarboxylate transporter 2/3/5
MSAAADVAVKNRKYYIHSGIGFAIMVFFRFIPPLGTLTAVGMEVVGIFIGLLYLWIILNSTTWPSILGLVMLGMGSYYEGAFPKAMAAAVTNSSAQMLVLSMSILSLLTTTKVADQIANRLISSKAIKRRPWALTIIIVMTAYICSALKCPYIVIYICWEFIYTICKQTGLTKDSKWTKMVIVGVPFATTIGMVTMPFSIAALSGFGYLASMTNNQYTFNALKYTTYASVLGLVIMLFYFVLCRLIFNPDMKKLKEVDLSVNIAPFSGEQKFALFIVCLYVGVAILPAVLPANWGITTALNRLTLVGIACIVLVTVLFRRSDKGKDLYTFGDLSKSANVWNFISMIAVAATFGSALSSESVGFFTLFGDLFRNILEGRSPYIFAVILCIATCLLTNIISNAVTMALMTPLAITLSVAMDANPVPVVLMVIFSAATGFILPSSSTAGAILNANLEWTNIKDIVAYGGVALFAFVLACSVFGLPFAGLIYG